MRSTLPLALLLATLSACLHDAESQRRSLSSGTSSVGQTGTPPGGSSSGQSRLDAELRAEILRHGLTGDPSIGRNLPSINDPLAQLGMELFFTKGLGGDMNVACATCHYPTLGGGDALSVGVGVDAVVEDLVGPGRSHAAGSPNYDGGPTIPRNAPTTFNMGMWDEVMFLNGRIESLGKTPGANGDDGQGITSPDVGFPQSDPRCPTNLPMAQARFPTTSMDEMKGFTFEFGNFPQPTREHLAARIGDYGIGAGEMPYSDWLDAFRVAFNDPLGTAQDLITEQNIAIAMGEYERSQVFVANPWSEYVAGDDLAIDDDAKRGALLFLRPTAGGGADCASCHGGDFFTDEKFYVVAMPQVGRGQSVNIGHTLDVGRFLVDGLPQHLYAFRTPSLLNVAETGPWSHAGGYTSLEAVVRHHLNPAEALQNYDFNQLAPDVQTQDTVANTTLALQQLYWCRSNGFPTVVDQSLSQKQIDQLISFLHALTDPGVTDPAVIRQWIPSGADRDGLRLYAHDQNGNPL